MSPTTTNLWQYEIPGSPQSAVVRHYSLAAVDEMEIDFHAALSSQDAGVVGVSIELAPPASGSCIIQTLVLALQNQVSTFLCGGLRPGHKAESYRSFSDIQYLAGFELSYTITLLAHTLGSDISGYDLSMVSDLTMPGNFLNRMDPSISATAVNERWDEGIVRGILLAHQIQITPFVHGSQRCT
jgi:hypothetical protein